MEVTKIDVNGVIEQEVQTSVVTETELCSEYKYQVALKILNEMTEKGIVSEKEYGKLQLNAAEKFSPTISGILPKTT